MVNKQLLNMSEGRPQSLAKSQMSKHIQKKLIKKPVKAAGAGGNAQ
jgi:hypothetical protein